VEDPQQRQDWIDDMLEMKITGYRTPDKTQESRLLARAEKKREPYLKGETEFTMPEEYFTEQVLPAYLRPTFRRESEKREEQKAKAEDRRRGVESLDFRQETGRRGCN